MKSQDTYRVLVVSTLMQTLMSMIGFSKQERKEMFAFELILNGDPFNPLDYQRCYPHNCPGNGELGLIVVLRTDLFTTEEAEVLNNKKLAGKPKVQFGSSIAKEIVDAKSVFSDPYIPLSGRVYYKRSIIY